MLYSAICKLIGGALNVVMQEYPTMLSAREVQKHLRDYLFHGLCKHLHDSMHCMYDNMRIMYPQLMTAACKSTITLSLSVGSSVV